MPIDFSRPRHFTEVTPAAVAWLCPSCRSKNTSRFEEGCPACGAGTQAQLAAAQKVNEAPVDLIGVVLIPQLRESPRGKLIVEMLGFTPAARETVAAALAFAAEHGMPPVSEGLERKAMIAWARAIAAVDE